MQFLQGRKPTSLQGCCAMTSCTCSLVPTTWRDARAPLTLTLPNRGNVSTTLTVNLTLTLSPNGNAVFPEVLIWCRNFSFPDLCVVHRVWDRDYSACSLRSSLALLGERVITYGNCSIITLTLLREVQGDALLYGS